MRRLCFRVQASAKLGDRMDRAEIMEERIARFADLLKRLDIAAERAPRRDRRMAQALVLEEFWRVARLDDVRLADACGRAAAGALDADTDALIAERVRRESFGMFSGLAS